MIIPDILVIFGFHFFFLVALMGFISSCIGIKEQRDRRMAWFIFLGVLGMMFDIAFFINALNLPRHKIASNIYPLQTILQSDGTTIQVIYDESGEVNITDKFRRIYPAGSSVEVNKHSHRRGGILFTLENEISYVVDIPKTDTTK